MEWKKRNLKILFYSRKVRGTLTNQNVIFKNLNLRTFQINYDYLAIHWSKITQTILSSVYTQRLVSVLDTRYKGLINHLHFSV